MSSKSLAVLVPLLSIILVLAACSGLANQTSIFADQEPAKRPDVPEQYSGNRNPFVEDPIALSDGENLFEANCSSCHGITGEGDGPASGGINPPPGNLALRQERMSDAYLYWRISEGGLMEPFNSLMPGWKGMLNDQNIWKIITYIRTMIVL
jgi:mono/diheme cytochrome c family protein